MRLIASTRHLAALALLALGGIAAAQSGNEGARLYAQHCSSCHGADAAGGGASSLVDAAWTNGGEPEAVAKSIKDGIPDEGMPGFGASLSDDEIETLVGFLEAARDRRRAPPRRLPESLETRDYVVGVETFVGTDAGLGIPWALTFIDADTALVTERVGRLRVIEKGVAGAPVEGLPPIVHAGQGGLLDVAIDPDFAKNGWVYLAYSHAREDGTARPGAPAMTRIVRGKLRDNRWVDQEVVWEARPEHYMRTAHHFGCRITFDREGHLYFSIGDRGRQRDAQNLGVPNGKIHRVQTDGTIPTDNPFLATEGALPSIWSYGHRNPQGLATHPDTGAIWETEHGPKGGDELNVIARGLNYGWPVITYGLNYNGSVITEEQQAPGMEQPTLFWTPSIAVCGMEFVRGAEFPRWDGHILVTGLASQLVERLHVVDERVLHRETLLRGQGRVRDVAVDASGAIYVVLNGPDIIVKLTMERPSVTRRR